MKIVQIAGYFGSGKTSLVLALSRMTTAAGLKVAVLGNESDSVLGAGDGVLTVTDIGGGCICCQVAGQLIRAIEALARDARPDLVLIEPKGVAVPGAIRDAVTLCAKKAGAVLGPTVVLFDATRSEKLLAYDSTQRLVLTQLRDADIVALSKIDAVPAAALDQVEKTLREINSATEIIRLSVVTGEGLAALAGRLRDGAAAAGAPGRAHTGGTDPAGEGTGRP
jgi:G3E family GTPase